MDKLVQELLDAASVVVGNLMKNYHDSRAVPDDLVELCLAIMHVEKSQEKSTANGNLTGAVSKLLKFIEENDVEDEMADDDDGRVDTWRSSEFNDLINYTQEKLDEAKIDHRRAKARTDAEAMEWEKKIGENNIK